MWSAKEQGLRSCWISRAFLGEDFESDSDSGSVLPLWILALGQSSPGGGGWMGKKSGNISPAARGPSLKVGKAGRGWWPQLPCEASDLCPPPLLEPVGELEAAAGDPTHNAGRVETPRGIRISIWEQKPISNCGLSPFPLCVSAMGTPSQEASGPLVSPAGQRKARGALPGSGNRQLPLPPPPSGR